MSSFPNASPIDAFLEAELDRYLAETAELCRQPSVSATGEGTHACAALVAQVLARHGLQVETYPTAGNPIIVGRAAGQSERTLLFYNHYDVQPPEPLELWTTPPYEPALRAGALYARGAKDDKGELVARLAAMEAVRAAHEGELPCGVIFVVEGEEEIGSPHIAEFVREHREALRCHGAIWEEGGINPDGSLIQILGRRGVLDVELAVETMKRDAHSGGAHNLPSAAWRLVWALASLKGPDERIRIPGFYDRARPPSERDLAWLEIYPTHEAVTREMLGLKEFLLGRTGPALNRAVFDPTCNIEGITTGYQGPGMKTIVPARASAKLDFRLVPDMDVDDVFARLRAHLDAEGFEDVAATRGGGMWPARVSPDDPLVRLEAEAAQAIYGQPPVVLPLAGGSSPVYAFAGPLGIPVISPGVGYWDNRTHAPDEHVRVSDFLNAARHIARILDRFADLA